MKIIRKIGIICCIFGFLCICVLLFYRNFSGSTVAIIPLANNTVHDAQSLKDFWLRRNIAFWDPLEFENIQTDAFKLSPDMNPVTITLRVSKWGGNKSSQGGVLGESNFTLIGEDGTTLWSRNINQLTLMRRPLRGGFTLPFRSEHYLLQTLDITKDQNYTFAVKLNKKFFSGIKNDADIEVRRNVAAPDPFYMKAIALLIAFGVVLIIATKKITPKQPS